jgi:hypothetical protein
MAQPDFVPILATDRVRPSNRLSIPGRWEQDRPAEQVSLRPPSGAGLGATGSDLGFGLKLAKRVGERAVLGEGEHLADAVAGCFSSGTRRSSHFHRSPVIYDMEWAFMLWGFLPGAPDDLVAFRRPIFSGADHDYGRQRAVADMVAAQALVLPLAELRDGLPTHWRKWTGAGAKLLPG